MTPLRLGTRGSRLALTQSQTVADALAQTLGRRVELVTIRSLGDDLTGPLSQAPQPGIFVSTLREALLRGEVDLVVHSMKDLPAAPIDGIVIAAIPEREDPRDILISHARCPFQELPAGARIGTSSPRRASQIRRLRPDLTVVDARGNIDTRIELARSGSVDAVVLAAAGVRRIGRADEVDDYLGEFISAPAQGALAVEVSTENAELLAAVGSIDHVLTRRQVMAERAVLSGLAATCTSAVAAFASADEVGSGAVGVLTLTAEVGGTGHGDERVRRCVLQGVVATGDDRAAVDLGTIAAHQLLQMGAGELLDDGVWCEPDREAPAVWVTRPRSGAARDVEELRQRGVRVLEAPVLMIRADTAAREQAAALVASISREADLLAVTSAAAVRALQELFDAEGLTSAIQAGQARGMQVIAVGSATARGLEEIGARDVLVPSVQDAQGMLATLRDADPGIAVLPRGNLAMKGLAEGLSSRGWTVFSEQVYLTEPVVVPEGATEALVSGAINGVVLRSPSAVRVLRDSCGDRRLPENSVLFAGGSTTAAAIDREWPNRGGTVDVPSEPSPTAVAERVLQIFPLGEPA